MPFRKSRAWGWIKPPVGSIIDYSGIGNRMCFAAVFNEGAGLRPRDSVSGKAGTGNASMTWTVGPYGKGVQGLTTAAAVTAFHPAIVTSDNAGTGDFTMMTSGNVVASAVAQRCLFNQGNAAGNLPLCQLAGNQDGNGATASGSFAFMTYNAGYAGIALASSIDGNNHVWAGVRQAGLMSLYKDGVLVVGPTAKTVKGVWGAASSIVIGSDVVVVEYSQCRQDFAYAWNRALQPSEIHALWQEPFLMFESPKRRIISAVTAAGGFKPYWASRRSRVIGAGVI